MYRAKYKKIPCEAPRESIINPDFYANVEKYCQEFFHFLFQDSKVLSGGELQFLDIGADSCVFIHKSMSENGTRKDSLIKVYAPLRRSNELSYQMELESVHAKAFVKTREMLKKYFLATHLLRERISSSQPGDNAPDFFKDFSLEIAPPGLLIQRVGTFASVIRNPVPGKNFSETEGYEVSPTPEAYALEAFAEHVCSVNLFLRQEIARCQIANAMNIAALDIVGVNAKPAITEGKLKIVITDIAVHIHKIFKDKALE